MLILFDRMYERDGHTHTDRHADTQTPHDSIGRDCKASRGKNSPRITPLHIAKWVRASLMPCIDYL